MRLKRLLLCLAVEASESRTSDEIQGRGFGISDGHVHVTTTIQTSINHATDNLQTCLEMGGVWNAMAVNPYCALPITTTSAAPTPAHRSSEQAKLDCLEGGHYWIADQNGAGFSYCSWSAPTTQAPVAAPSTFTPILTLTADSFDNENDCENNGFYWHQFPTYGYCDDAPKVAFNNAQVDCMDNNGRWIPQLQLCEMACSKCEGTCSTDLVCVCGNGQFGQNCEKCYAGFVKVKGSGCIRGGISVRDCSGETNCNGRGTCSEENGVRTCTCYAGFSGARCEIDNRPDPCRDILNNCNGRGTCMTGSMGIHKCTCYSGYTGSRCENVIQTDPCINNVCNGRGSCSSRLENGILIAECACYSGFTGRFCTDNVRLDPCEPLRFCNENGACIRNRDRTTARCQCNQGWTGDACLTRQRVTCNDLNYCNKAGDCITSNGGDSRCRCNDKFYGDKCQFEKQDSRCKDQSFCSNGGVCYETATTKYCKCPDGYEGAQCQYAPGTPKCDYTNCNNGVCDYDIEGHPFCVCQNGWKGPYCEVAIPCVRDCPFGKCTHGKNSQYCADCPENFFGRECKYDCNACGDDEICDKTTDSDGNVISARCAVKPVSVCEASSNICMNGCECIDSVKDGYYFTCKNAPSKNFLGKRCQWNEPILKCGTDSIEIEITNSFHENFSFSKKTYSVGSYSKATDQSSQTKLIISKNENPDVFRTRVVDGSLVMSSDVVLSLAQDNNPSFFSKMRVMTFACKYSIGDVVSDAFSPASWPSETLVENNVNFNVDLKFYSVDASFEQNRRARESAFVLHGEDVYVSAAIHDSIDDLPSDINLYYQNCDLRQQDLVIPVIANGCPVTNTNGRQSFADVSFYTAQPTNGIEFKMTVLGFQKQPLKLTCEVSFCAMGNCNTDYCNGRKRRAISRPTIMLEVSPIYILAPQAENYQGQQVNLS